MSLDPLQNAIQQSTLRTGASANGFLKQLQKLMAADTPMQRFLEEVLPIAAGLFTAKAAQIWLRAHGSKHATFAIRYGISDVVADEKERKKYERILQLAWQQRQPMMVEPQNKKRSSGEAKAPQLILGPIIHRNETIALLEIVLPDSAPEGASERRSMLRAMQLTIDAIHEGLQKRLSLPTASLQQAESQIHQLEQEIEAYHLSILRTIETRLRQFQGWTFGSFAENAQFAKVVHRILDEHGFRVRCPECGHPAILRCSSAGNSKSGVFVFDHYLEGGRTFHGGPTTFPAITLVPKPARRASLNAS